MENYRLEQAKIALFAKASIRGIIKTPATRLSPFSFEVFEAVFYHSANVETGKFLPEPLNSHGLGEVKTCGKVKGVLDGFFSLLFRFPVTLSLASFINEPFQIRVVDVS